MLSRRNVSRIAGVGSGDAPQSKVIVAAARLSLPRPNSCGGSARGAAVVVVGDGAVVVVVVDVVDVEDDAVVERVPCVRVSSPLHAPSSVPSATNAMAAGARLRDAIELEHTLGEAARHHVDQVGSQ